MGYSPRALATWIRHTGGVPSPFGGDPVSHMLHLERDEPDIAAAARWYLEPVDYLTMRFTGRAAATHASMSGAWLTDNRRLDRLEYDPMLVGKLGLDVAKLPPLVQTGSMIGAVRPEVASELGLSPSAQVVTGTPDLHSAALGCGAIGEGQPHITISTTSWISLPFPRKKTDALHSIATVPGLDSSSYLVANNHEAAGLCLRWLQESFTVDEPAGYGRLIELAESSPPGSGGILFTPWIAGERSPVDDRHARGGWHNLSVETRNADLIRSVLEGVAYNSRWLNEAVEHFAKRRLDPIRIFGGGAVPDLWCQIHADVMDRPDRARRRSDARQPPWRRTVRRARPRRGVTRRGPRARACGPRLRAESSQPGDLRPPLHGVSGPLQGPAQDVRPPQRLRAGRFRPGTSPLGSARGISQ